MPAAQQHASGNPAGFGAQALRQALSRSVTKRVFTSVLADVSVILDCYDARDIDDAQLVEFLRDRLDALTHLQDDGTVSKALERAETALVEAVMASPDVVNFEAARREFAGQNPDANGPESDSGTGFAISNTNSNTRA